MGCQANVAASLLLDSNFVSSIAQDNFAFAAATCNRGWATAGKFGRDLDASEASQYVISYELPYYSECEAQARSPRGVPFRSRSRFALLCSCHSPEDNPLKEFNHA